jgi:alkylation response protein AidB-like acyl-CoA dehydrogenase
MLGQGAEQRALLEAVGGLVDKVVAPRAAEIDQSNSFPTDVMSAMAEMGLFGLWIPEEYGGAGLDLRTGILIVERISRVCPAAAMKVVAPRALLTLLMLGGTEALKERYLPLCASGEVFPCIALSEPNAGSDVSGISTSARRSGDGYVLNGRKTWCSGAPHGDVFVVLAKVDGVDDGISAFLIDADADGLSIGIPEDLVGLRGSLVADVVLEDVVVPQDRRLGAEGDGLKIMFAELDEERLTTAAMALGAATGALGHAVAYARERVQFGKPIIDHQGLQFLLADLTTETAAASTLLDQGIAMLERGQSRTASVYASMAKLFCTEVAMRVTAEAVQVFGGYGLSRSYPVERLMRDAKAFRIFDGTNQIQRIVIGRYLKRFPPPLDPRLLQGNGLEGVVV